VYWAFGVAVGDPFDWRSRVSSWRWRGDGWSSEKWRGGGQATVVAAANFFLFVDLIFFEARFRFVHPRHWIELHGIAGVDRGWSDEVMAEVSHVQVVGAQRKRRWQVSGWFLLRVPGFDLYLNSSSNRIGGVWMVVFRSGDGSRLADDVDVDRRWQSTVYTCTGELL
jgi:hypothetical protein